MTTTSPTLPQKRPQWTTPIEAPPMKWGGLIARHLDSVRDAAQELPYDDDSRFIFLSDFHRGDGGPTDRFAPNAPLALHILEHYYERGFTYIEVGDGDELWENARFEDIRRAHAPFFGWLHRFAERDRLHIIFGNHDVQGLRHRAADKDGLPVVEALNLRHRHTGQRVLVTHGHQADLKSHILIPVSRFVVRHLWGLIQKWNLSYVKWWFSRKRPSKAIDRQLMTWAGSRQQVTICGHTHRPAAGYDTAPYFNTGSGVRPGHITGLELHQGALTLVRWIGSPANNTIRRELVAPARTLHAFA